MTALPTPRMRSTLAGIQSAVAGEGPQCAAPTPSASTSPLAAPDRYDGLLMLQAPAEALRRLQEFQAFVKNVMVEGVDFGKVPGSDKPSLWQPGAQKLAEVYGLASRFFWTEAVKDWAAGFFYFEVKCELRTRADDRFVGEGIGSCNSREARYAHRWLFSNELPPGTDVAVLRSQERWSEKKKKYYTVYCVPNEDLASLVNTMQKIACKRSLVHAVISVTRSSGLFTQDLEDLDLPSYAFGSADDERPWDRGETRVVTADGEVTTAAAAPSSKQADTEPAKPPEAKMTPDEEAAVQRFEAQFEQAPCEEDFSDVRTKSRRAGGKNPTKAYREWHRAQVEKGCKRLGIPGGPGTAKVSQATSSSEAAVSS